MALKQLRSEKSIVIQRADKGNSTVVMNRTTYNEKIIRMLSDTNVYQTLNKDPTPTFRDLRTNSF